MLLLLWEVKEGSCWLYGDRLKTERFDVAEVSLLPLERKLAADWARVGEEEGGGKGERVAGRA